VSTDDIVEPSDRRGLERRVDMLDRDLRQLETQVAVMQATLNGLVSTMDSRHRAFERGQDLILERLEKLHIIQVSQESEIKTLSVTPQDLSKMVFSPRVVVAVLTLILSIFAGQQASTWGMRSDVRNIDTRMNGQAEVEQSRQKLQDERSTALRSAVDAIGRKQELNQIQFQELRDEVRGRPTRQQ
jgi:uncharacterized protein YlxW (UPF0749 family)